MENFPRAITGPERQKSCTTRLGQPEVLHNAVTTARSPAQRGHNRQKSCTTRSEQAKVPHNAVGGGEEQGAALLLSRENGCDDADVLPSAGSEFLHLATAGDEPQGVDVLRADQVNRTLCRR
jgi:hypothetical protein